MIGLFGRASSCAKSFSALRSRTDRAAARPRTLVVPRDCTVDRRRSRSCCEGPKRATIARPPPSRTKNLSFHTHGKREAPAGRPLASWTVPPRDAAADARGQRMYNRERLYSYPGGRSVNGGALFRAAQAVPGRRG